MPLEDWDTGPAVGVCQGRVPAVSDEPSPSGEWKGGKISELILQGTPPDQTDSSPSPWKSSRKLTHQIKGHLYNTLLSLSVQRDRQASGTAREQRLCMEHALWQGLLLVVMHSVLVHLVAESSEKQKTEVSYIISLFPYCWVHLIIYSHIPPL